MKKTYLFFLVQMCVIQGFSQLPSCYHLRNLISNDIDINQSFDSNQMISPFTNYNSITGISFKGTITNLSDNSFARIILVDSALNEYLIFESYPLIYGVGSKSYDSICEETSLLSNIRPIEIKIILYNSNIVLNKLYISTTLDTVFTSTKYNEIHNDQINFKIQNINNAIQFLGLSWVADSTMLSHLFYVQKHRLFPLDTEFVWQGIEYYSRGVFDLLSSSKQNNLSIMDTKMCDDFDWRNRHGANKISSPYYNNTSDNNGWITSIKDQNKLGPGTCMHFGAIATLEALTNLYYNRFINPDLSEQYVISCFDGTIDGIYNYIDSKGSIEDSCLLYNGLY